MRLFYLLFSIFIMSVFTSCTPPPESYKQVSEDIKVKGSFTDKDTEYFIKYYREMQEAVKNKDADKAFSFYSKNFMSDAGIKLSQMKKNISL